MWASGDYPSMVETFLLPLGPRLVDACAIGPEMTVLDVAAGPGNASIPAAQRGARVTASDLTPELFDAGRARAEAAGVELEWVEADAEALPFDDDAFDVVTSSLGAIFPSDHQAVADELVRVCRPGGTIGMINFTPEIDDFFAVFAPYGPPTPPGPTPGRWGSEAHLRELFGDRLESLELTRGRNVERADSPRAYRELFKRTFGPVVGIYAGLADQPERAAALDRDLLELATQANRGRPGGAAEYPYEYLLVVARKRRQDTS
jgi:ubiquinone/menaquinone biosynthesis C-methylase UbiE